MKWNIYDFMDKNFILSPQYRILQHSSLCILSERSFERKNRTLRKLTQKVALFGLWMQCKENQPMDKMLVRCKINTKYQCRVFNAHNKFLTEKEVRKFDPCDYIAMSCLSPHTERNLAKFNLRPSKCVLR